MSPFDPATDEQLYESRVVDATGPNVPIRVTGPAAVRAVMQTSGFVKLFDLESAPPTTAALPQPARMVVGIARMTPPVIFRRGVVAQLQFPGDFATITYRALTPAEVAADKDGLR